MSFPNRPFPVPGRLNPSQVLPSGNSAQADSTERRPEFSESNAEVVLSSLRAAIAARASEPRAILKAIAEAAQALTSADGAALALRRDGVVVCCARSGETAPDVGTRLSENSGISSECLRTGEAMRCDDTYTDHRVDPVVCRILGVRSIAIAPLRQQGHIIGILEAFSTRAYAFSERHMGFLAKLAGLTEAAQTQEHPPEKPVRVKAPEPPPPPPPTFGSTWSAEPSSTVATDFLEKLQPSNRRRRVAGVAVVTLALLALIGSWVLYEPESAAVQPPPVTYAEVVPAEPAAESPVSTIEVTIPGPGPNQPQKTVKEKPEAHAVNQRSRHARKERAKEEEVAPDVVTHIQNPPVRTVLTPPPPIKRNAPAPPPAPAPITEPKIVLVPSDNMALGSLLGTPTRTPTLPPPISSGVSLGALEHKVQPIYPRSAIAMGLRGSVVLQITIGENGKIRGLKVVEGNPILARAAMDAVRQWRYRPALLNGKPTQAQTQVTVNFLLP
jgi:TonB family protein